MCVLLNFLNVFIIFQCVNLTRLALLPPGTELEPNYAHEYTLMGVKFPSDSDDRLEAVRAFSMDTLNKKLFLNIENRGSPPAVTLVDPLNNADIAKVNSLRVKFIDCCILIALPFPTL